MPKRSYFLLLTILTGSPGRPDAVVHSWVCMKMKP